GAVSSHVRIGFGEAGPHAQRIPACEADLLLGCDSLASGSPEALACLRPGRSQAVINTFEQPTGHFAHDADWRFPADTLRALIGGAVGGRADFLDATALATRL